MTACGRCWSPSSPFLTGERDGATTAYVLGRIAGALYLLNDLPYARESRDELERATDPAHRLNRKIGLPCGCQTRKRCVIEGVNPDLREVLSRVDAGLNLGREWWEDEDDE